MATTAETSQGIGSSRWLVLVAAAPLLVAIALLQLMGWPADPLSAAELAVLKTELVRPSFVPGEITYLAIVVVHTCACAVVIWLAADIVRRTPGGMAYGGVAVAMTVALAIAFPVGAWLSGVTAYQVTYHAIVDTLRGMGAGESFAGTDRGGITPLVLTMLLPSWLGIAAVASMSAAANAQLERFPPAVGTTGEARVAYVAQINARLKRCLYALSIVLVTSTVSASLFFHLMANFAVPPKSAGAALLSRLGAYASELSIFWGCVYTLTLGAAVGLPLMLFQQRVGTRLEALSADAAAAEECKRLADAGILSGGGEQLKFVATFLAPLAAGPISNFVQATPLFAG